MNDRETIRAISVVLSKYSHLDFEKVPALGEVSALIEANHRTHQREAA